MLRGTGPTRADLVVLSAVAADLDRAAAALGRAARALAAADDAVGGGFGPPAAGVPLPTALAADGWAGWAGWDGA
ncbi:hypothetical protein, partial [Cellulomonas endophytica]|uniref:hypothetical protein n=1 Tax=Cellulomonas endophytica TaxID=2494735 RepID=UPI00196B0B76